MDLLSDQVFLVTINGPIGLFLDLFRSHFSGGETLNLDFASFGVACPWYTVVNMLIVK